MIIDAEFDDGRQGCLAVWIALAGLIVIASIMAILISVMR